MLKTGYVSYRTSFITISYQKVIRFIFVGKSLHLIALIGFGIFVFGLKNAIPMLGSPMNLIYVFWWYLTIFGLSLLIFAEMDANGRYQDYKKIKDVLYKYGFDARLIRPFMNSKCQRDSVLTASKDLNYLENAKKIFYEDGYRWYHMLPNGIVKNPFIIFRKEFWFKILFTNTYHLKYFYW